MEKGAKSKKNNLNGISTDAELFSYENGFVLLPVLMLSLIHI